MVSAPGPAAAGPSGSGLAATSSGAGSQAGGLGLPAQFMNALSAAGQRLSSAAAAGASILTNRSKRSPPGSAEQQAPSKRMLTGVGKLLGQTSSVAAGMPALPSQQQQHAGLSDASAQQQRQHPRQQNPFEHPPAQQPSVAFMHNPAAAVAPNMTNSARMPALQQSHRFAADVTTDPGLRHCKGLLQCCSSMPQQLQHLMQGRCRG